jgi:hypothetical protein
MVFCISGVEGSQISHYSVSQKINITFDLLDNKAPSKIEKNDTNLDSHVMNHICCF